MNGILLGIVGVIYVAVGINYLSQDNIGMAIVFVAYAVANAGLYFAGSTV